MAGDGSGSPSSAGAQSAVQNGEPIALTQDALRAHGRAQAQQDSSQDSSHFIEVTIRKEATSEYERALFGLIYGQLNDWTDHSAYDDELLREEVASSLLVNLDHITRLYAPGPKQSHALATPAYMFFTVSPANDPYPLQARIALQNSNLILGALQSLQERDNATQNVATGSGIVNPDWEAEAEAGWSTQCRCEQSESHTSLPDLDWSSDSVIADSIIADGSSDETKGNE